MPAFDADSYFNRRSNERIAVPAGYDGGPSVGRSKFDELMAASAEKTAALQFNAEQSTQARAASEDSWVGKLGLDPEGLAGTVLNIGAAAVEGAVNIPRYIGTSLHTLNAAALDANIPDAAKLAEQRYSAGTATAEDMNLLNLTAGMVKEPVWQTPMQAQSRKGAQSNLQRIESMKEALRKASIVRDTMDVSSIVQRDRQQVLQQDLKDGFKPGMAQVSEGWDDVKNGDAVTGSAKSAIGVARLLLNIGTSAVTNPVAALEYVASNVPQLLLASGGAAGMAMANLPYAIEEFGKGITAYQKEHGSLPPANEMQRMAALAGSLALAETVGDKLTLGAGKVGGLFGKEAVETGQAVTRKGFKDSLFNPRNSAVGRTGAAVVEGGAGEFATEAYQTTAENAIQGKETSLEDAYVGGALGAISGGTLSGGIHAGSELATGIARAPKAAKPAQSTQPVDSPQQQLDFKAAIASNDPSVFLDQASPSYNPVKAVSVLQAINDNADTAPEVKQANYQQAQTIVTDLDSQLENAKEDYQFARKSPAAKQAEVDFYKAELAKIDPADTEGKATYETMVAHYEGMLAPLTAAQVRSTEADLSRMDRQLKEARTVKGRMVPQVTPAAFAQQVAAVQAPVDPQDAEAITASKAAATSLINLSMASPELLTPEVAKQLYKSTSSGLDDSQREYLRVFSEARIAQNALQDSDSVHQTILYGDKKNDQAGIVQHRERISDAITAGNQRAAERGLKTLNSFAVDQAGKASAMQAALDSDAVQKNRQTVQVVKNKDTGQWEQYTGDIPLTEKERAANGGLNIHRGSGKIVGSIAAGATAISSAAAEMESAYGLKFGNVLNKANKTNTSSAPVQKTKEPIQVPVVPSLSPSIDKKVLEGEERVNTKVLPLSAGKANWSRYAPAGTGYEVSTQGDTRFSALNAKLADGRTIEEAYQLDVKGFRDPAKLNQSWKDGKGKAPKTPLTPTQTWEAYKGLWQQWAKENPKLIQELRTASAGKTLTDKFAGTPVSQARALAEILAAEASQETQTAAPDTYTNHSGGAIGADSMFDTVGKSLGFTKHQHYFHGASTPKGNVRLTNDQVNEGIVHAKAAASVLARPWNDRYASLLGRNWFQVKNATQIIAVAPLVKPGERDSKGFISKAKRTTVDGGTGYAVEMAIAAGKEVHVFDTKTNQWFLWDGAKLKTSTVPVLAQNYAGIGSRQDNGTMTPESIQAIKDVYAKASAPNQASTQTTPTQAATKTIAAEQPTKAQDAPTSPEFSKQADQNLEYLRNPPMDYTSAKATEIGAWAQSNIAALTKAMQDAGEDLDEADRLETLRADMRWMVSKAKEMVAADTVLEENLGPQGDVVKQTNILTADPVAALAQANKHIADDAASAEPILTGMKVREATAQETAAYAPVVAEMTKLYPTTAGKVSFLVHTGHRWKGGALSNPTSDQHVITVLEDELTAFMTNPEAGIARIKTLLVHELSHIADVQNIDQDGNWASNQLDPLKFDGYQFMEAEAAARNIGEWIPKKDAVILRKHFGWVISKFKNDPAQSQREMYAQLQALYVVHPDLMEKYLGQTYAAYSGKPAITGAANPSTAEAVSGNAGSTSIGLGETAQSQEPATDEPRVSGVAAEPAATGNLTILSKSAAEELPEGTLLGKVYQTINKAVAFLTQKETKVEKDEDIAKDRPLVSIANFLSRWNKEEVTPDSFFVNELSTEENLALNTFKEYATAWSEVAKADFIKGSLPNGAGNKIREDYLFHDPVQDFINPDGSVDENLVTAVVAASYSWLVDSLNNPPRKLKDGILTMHGLKEDDTLTSKGRDDLARFATMEDTAINSMGDILVDVLGLQANSKAPKDYLAKVSAAFGVHALRLLETQGLIKRVTLQKATLTEYMPDLVLPDYASISYVEIVRAGKEEKFALEGDSRRIRDSVVGSGAVLDRLFGSEHSPAEASWKPIPFNQTKAKRTAQGISDKQHAIITEAQQHENRIIPAMWTALQVLGDAVILQAAGHVEYDETKIQKENQDSVLAQNLNLENQLEGMQQLVGQAEAASPLGLEQPFFANHEVWRNFRVGITTRNMNLQTSKIHRFMFFRPEWASTIRMDEDAKVEHFKVALAAAFGIKTDQQPNAQTVEMFDAMLAKADNRIVDLAMKLHADIQNPDSPLLSQEEKSAIGALSAGKEGMQTLQAMVALGIYLDAMVQGKEDFTVHLLVGVDGKTNGPILSHLALGAASSVEELFKHMNRGGMFQREGRFKNFNHWYQQATSLDLYEDLARVVLGAIPKNMPNMDAFYVITKDLLHNGKVTGAGRKIVKTPLTSFAFGSTIEKSLQNMQQAFLQGVIDRIESVANDPAGSVSREKLITSINALIKMGGNRYAEMLPRDASIEELMGMEFSKAQKQALEGAFGIIMGDALESSMKTYFEVFMKRRDAVNGAIQTAYGVYAAIYQDLRNIELNRLMDSGEIGFTQTKDGREPWYDLTNAQEQALREKVANVLPRAHTAYTQGTDALKDGLMMAKSRRGVSQLPMHKVKAQLAQRFTDAKGKQVSHIDTRAMTTSETSPGVAGLPYFMHSLDSFIMHMSLKGTESLNVHDEAANGADKVTGTAKAINGATWTGMLNFSPATEAYEMLERSLVNAVKLLESEDISQASLDLIRAAFLKQIPYKIRKQVKPENIALVAMQMAKGHQFKAEQIRLGTLVQMGYLDQYTWEGGEYEVTDADTAAAQAKLDALDKLMTYESDQAAEALGKAFKAGIKTKPVTVIVEADPTSSGMDDIDASDPNEETAASPVPPVLAGISTQELYAALPSTVSGTFDEHLRSLLDGMVSKLHGPFGSFKQATMTAQPLGPLERMAKAQSEGMAPLAVSALVSGIRFSDQEAFVMEQVQATVKATLEGNDGQTAITYGELSKLFMEAKKRIIPADFATGDPAQDQAIHDFLFNHTDAGKGNRSDYLARFAAVGLAHEGFNKLLQVETSRAAPVLKGEKTIAAFLKRAFDSLLDWFNGRMSNTQPGQKGSEKLTALVEQLVQIELKRQARAADTSFDIVDAFDEKSKALADGVAAKLGEIGKSAFFQQSRSKVLKASGSLVSMVAEDRVKWLVEGMNKFRDQYMDKEQGVIAAVFKDVVGYAAQQQVLLRMAVKNQGERKDIITNTTKLVRESFVNQGKELTDQAKSALTAVLLRTGAHTLLSPTFDTAQLQELLNDVNKLTAAIQAQEAMLSVFPARFQNYFLRQSKDLAHYLVHNEAKGQHLMLNAGNIARMYETIHQGKLSEAETLQAEAIIDSLVSLYALKMSSPDSKAEVVAMMKAEHARGDGGNGVQMALLLHKDMEQQAKERLFGDSPALMVKGYTPEIYNPYTAIQVVNAEEGKLLLEQGYARGDAVQPDPADPGAEAKHVYVLRDGGAQPLQTGILSYTGTRHKGSTLHSGKNVKMQKQVLLDKQAAIDKMFEPNPTYDPAKGKGNHMVPLLNATGKAVNYHYLMTAKTKDVLLERNSRFDDVLGVQAGSVFDKATVGEQNRKAIQALKDSYLEDFKNNPQAYVQVGPTSPDVENRELYKLLPKVTQQAITDIWGKEGLMVRSDHKDLYFGYHKLSLSSAWDKVDPNLMERALVTSVTWALENYAKYYLHMDGNQAKQYAKRGAVVVRRGENIWQAVVREIKDIYVIKAVTTMLNNIVSNLSLLSLNGVPVLDSLRYHQEAMRGASDYERDTAELFKLEQQIKVGLGMGDMGEAKQRLSRLKDAIARNPVKPLIDAGLMPTIVEDVEADVDPFSYKSQFLRKTEKYTSKLNPKVRQAARVAFMAHDTRAYKTLHHFTQLSDFVARYALYQHLTTRKKNALASPEALHAASEAFIFYDIPMHRKLQYVEDMGLVMFTKYFIRIQRVLAQRVKENPGRVLTSILTHHYIGGVPGVMDASAIAHFGNNPLSTGALGFPGALPDLGTVQAMDGMLGLLK